MEKSNSKIIKLFSRQQIEKRVADIAKKINKDFKNKKLLILSVLSGSVVFCSDIIRKLKIDFEIDFIKVSSYNGRQSSKKIAVKIKNNVDVKNKDVLIVDDICDTGRTLYYLKNLILKNKAKTVTLCSLVNRTVKKYRGVSVKYKGIEVKDGFLVGYGLDYNGKYRGLPYIGILK
ncbi:hypoxanthine phosphoribosyltransferase [Candidatus Ruminimicrobium bovinum]|uniref:hypoxanthine phosphoribosyltransferase n=1 Tax=Candidatus Ruminimicrobium bovinum TaxID=3242779 RepID=UPI0039B8A7EE